VVQDFWRLASLIICSVGFFAVLVAQLVNEVTFTDAVFRAVLAFAVIYVVQNIFGSILTAVVNTNSQALTQSATPTEEADDQQS
jgi:hypothetical protein